MLVEFSVQNFTSFNTRQTLSLLASSSTKENFNEINIFPIKKFGIDCLLKSATIFGANASGKSNLVHSFDVLKRIVLESITTADAENLNDVVPFLLKDDLYQIPCEFEVTFLYESNLYRYGIAILENKISEEWLYWTKTSRETMLFHRKGQKVEINNRSFSEAKDFVRKEDGTLQIEKTKEDVPFISVLAQFNGTKSGNVVRWFKRLRVIKGMEKYGSRNLTVELFEKDPAFKKWALGILSALQIYDVRIIEEEDDYSGTLSEEADAELRDAMVKLNSYFKRIRQKRKIIQIVKKPGDCAQEYKMPLSFESEGTKKLIYLLGPIYDVIVKEKILIIDEFDSKFHTLLSKYIIDLYHKKNLKNSQLILTCHDTNLLTKDLLRRDQIWFLEKNNQQETELYSLLEYKEHYTRKEDSYSKDYLSGKYGAIPLLNSIENLMCF